jgi:hypothetical protein
LPTPVRERERERDWEIFSRGKGREIRFCNLRVIDNED